MSVCLNINFIFLYFYIFCVVSRHFLDIFFPFPGHFPSQNFPAPHFRLPQENLYRFPTEIHFCHIAIEAHRATVRLSKTGLPRPVSRDRYGHPTPRRTAGPGPARVLVHPSETWSHPRGTLGRCLKGSETNNQYYKDKNELPFSFRPLQLLFPPLCGIIKARNPHQKG